MGTTVDRIAKKIGTRAKRVHTYLMQHPGKQQFSDIADGLQMPVDAVVRAVEQLAGEGKNIAVSVAGVEVLHDLPIVKHERIDVSGMKGEHHIYGVTADNHLGSKYSRLDVLNALFDLWAAAGVTKVLQCGNIIDGEFRWNKYDLLVSGMEGQVDYLLENWPRRKGIVTEFVTGDDHEGWYIQREGVNIGQYIELKAQAAGRNDLSFVGHMERQIEFVGKTTKSMLSMLHAGGGTAYAISYTSQKQVESYQPGEKPTILIAGHYHKFDFSYPRAVCAIQPGCTEDQTPWMRKKKIEAMVGGTTLEFDVDPRGLLSNFRVTWHPFYTRDFYKGEVWKYKWK